ncbi:hypothetical protein Pan153_56900 [Gimesia panareensis]|uniref:Leucine Rich repeats (2 copies) n=1 Tax=Gimesia panareensis TaxID=2527978 RepID=A0A518FX95_9PLAN|nr:hypothetical protein [Gimesia panareensis]QDV21008.1 hypothetical protein Pan153_56900 [Gimesia panareensis]
MFRQLTCVATVLLIAMAGIGCFLLTSDSTQNAVADKQPIALEPELKLQTDPRVPERTRRLEEINQILASRVPHISAVPNTTDSREKESWQDPEVERIYQQIRSQRLTIWYPRNGEPLSIWVGNPEKTVKGEKVYQHTQALQAAIPYINQLPFPVRIWFYGTRDQSNPELGECVETLTGVEKLHSVKFSYCRISPRGYEALQQLPQLTDLEILHSHLDEAALIYIAQIKQLRRLHLSFGDHKISAAKAEQLLDLSELEDFKLQIRLETKEVGRFWKKMSGCSSLVSLEVDCGKVSQDMMYQFLKHGDHQRLKSWTIRERIPRKKLADALVLAPNLEVLKVPSGSPEEMEYLLQRLAEHHTQLRNLTIGWDSGEHLKGKQARQALQLLSAFPQLQQVHVPIVLPDVNALEPLTRLSQLEHFYCKNLNLNQSTLFYLAQMPSLKSLSIRSLSFSDESAHLLPWLSHVESIEIENPQTLCNRRLVLLATMPELRELKWCNIATNKTDNLTDEVKARYPFIKYSVCGK